MSGQLDSIEEVIRKIDTTSGSDASPSDKDAKPQKEETRVVRLKHGVASELSGLIETEFCFTAGNLAHSG